MGRVFVRDRDVFTLRRACLRGEKGSNTVNYQAPSSFNAVKSAVFGAQPDVDHDFKKESDRHIKLAIVWRNSANCPRMPPPVTLDGWGLSDSPTDAAIFRTGGQMAGRKGARQDQSHRQQNKTELKFYARRMKTNGGKFDVDEITFQMAADRPDLAGEHAGARGAAGGKEAPKLC